MKVLLINGSPKDKGNTFTALSEVAKTLGEEGIDTEIINIGKKAVQGCIACGMCGCEGKCTFKDDLYMKIFRAVKDGIDGLIVGSPVYYGGPNGSLCALLDRVFYSLGPSVQAGSQCGRVPSRWCLCRLRPSEQVFHYPQHARSELPVLEHGLWPDTWTGSPRRGGHADDAYAGTQHGMDAETTQRQ